MLVVFIFSIVGRQEFFGFLNSRGLASHMKILKILFLNRFGKWGLNFFLQFRLFHVFTDLRVYWTEFEFFVLFWIP